MPVRFLMPLTPVLAGVGAYSFNNSFADLNLVFTSGVLGYCMCAVDLPLVPLILAAILAPKVEQSVRQAITLNDGDWNASVTRPISAVFLAVVVAVVVADIVSGRNLRRKLPEVSQRA